MKTVTVLSGKGGVGKSTVSASMACALAQRFSVALFDADIGGSNLHLMFRTKKDFDVKGGRIEPGVVGLDGSEFQFFSISQVSESFVHAGFGHGDFVKQILPAINFSADYLVVDGAPGLHGEVEEAVKLSDACVLVGIGGMLGSLDLRRAIEFLREVRAPVAGLYINFSKYVCDCGRETKLFGGSPSYEVPVIEEIPHCSSLPRLDLDRLLHHLENPVRLKPRPRSALKEKLTELYLRTIGRV